MALTVTAIDAPRGRSADSVTITGTGFNATPGNNTVTFGGVSATVTGGSGTTSLTVTVPGGLGTDDFQVAVVVTNTGNGDTNSATPRYFFVMKAITAYRNTHRIQAQQPGPNEVVAVESEKVPEAKDHERLAAYVEALKRDVLPGVGGSTIPNTTCGADLIGTDAAAFPTITPARSTIQAVLEKLYSFAVVGGMLFGTGSGALGATTVSSNTDAAGDKHYATLTVNTGILLATTAGRVLLVRSQGIVDIQGTGAVTADGRGAAGADGGTGTASAAASGTSTAGASGTFATAPLWGTFAATSGAAGGGSGGRNGGGTSGPGGTGAPGVARSLKIDGDGAGTAVIGGAGQTATHAGADGATTSAATALAAAARNAASDASFELYTLFPTGAAGGGGGGGGSGGASNTANTTTGTAGAGGTAGAQSGSGLGVGGNGTAGGNGNPAGGGGGGSAGGAGGGTVIIICHNLNLNGSARVSADGAVSGNAGAGGAGQTGANTAGGGSGGRGAPGAGGFVLCVYRTSTNVDASHVHAVAGLVGSGGAAGSGTQAGGAGSTGAITSEDGYTFMVATA